MLAWVSALLLPTLLRLLLGSTLRWGGRLVMKREREIGDAFLDLRD
jgi:hypothetical protein